MAKPRRTSQELLEAIMHEVRQHPEWNHILSVTITKRGAGRRVGKSAPTRDTREPSRKGQRQGLSSTWWQAVLPCSMNNLRAMFDTIGCIGSHPFRVRQGFNHVRRLTR